MEDILNLSYSSSIYECYMFITYELYDKNNISSIYECYML